MFSLIYSPHVICVFAVVLHEKLPLRTCHVTMCTPQAFCCIKRFSEWVKLTHHWVHEELVEENPACRPNAVHFLP